MIALDPEAADRVSDGHEKKLGKGTSPTQSRNFFIYYSPFGVLPSQNIQDKFQYNSKYYNFIKSFGCTFKTFVQPT